MIERAGQHVDVRAQIPEILERDFAVQLRKEDLAIPAVVVLRERADVRGIVLKPRPRLRLTIDEPGENISAIAIAEATRIVRVVRGGFPGVLEIVEPVPLCLPEPERPNRSRERRSRRVVMQVAANRI